jgi:hypothetical protein
MRHTEFELLEDDLEDILDVVTSKELGLPVDLGGDELDDDELGLRSLFENPDAVLGSSGWPDAA